jgi:hypothetical protein
VIIRGDDLLGLAHAFAEEKRIAKKIKAGGEALPTKSGNFSGHRMPYWAVLAEGHFLPLARIFRAAFTSRSTTKPQAVHR